MIPTSRTTASGLSARMSPMLAAISSTHKLYRICYSEIPSPDSAVPCWSTGEGSSGEYVKNEKRKQYSNGSDLDGDALEDQSDRRHLFAATLPRRVTLGSLVHFGHSSLWKRKIRMAITEHPTDTQSIAPASTKFSLNLAISPMQDAMNARMKKN